MFVAVVDFGPSTPFVGVLVGRFAVACLVATFAVWAISWRDLGQRPNRSRQASVWALVWAATVVLWGSAAGEGGPLPTGGTSGQTRCGILCYLTVTSHNAAPGAAWMHDLDIHPWALLETVVLSAVFVAAASIAVRLSKQAEPDTAPDPVTQDSSARS